MSIYFAIFLPKGLYLNVGSVVKDYYTIVQALRYSVLWRRKLSYILLSFYHRLHWLKQEEAGVVEGAGEDFHPDPAQDIAHHPDLAQNIAHPPDPLPDLNFLEIEFLLKANYELPFW